MRRCRSRLPAVLTAAAVGGCGQPPGGAADLELTLDNIHRTTAGARTVAVSPDGRRVAITGTGPDGPGIYVTATAPADRSDAMGTEPRLWVRGTSPSWAPDGSRIAFLRDGDLWVAAVDELEGRRLTSRLDGTRAPAVSPDGERVAFYSSESGHQDIWLVPADGSAAARRLTEAAMSLDDPRFVPTWSPDARHLAYVSNEADYWHDDVWIVDTRTGDRRQLSRSLMAMSSPVWSPDGTRLAVFGTAKDEYWYEDLAYIYLLDLETGEERAIEMQVYATDAIMRHRPWWSDDGSALFFPYLERGSTNLWTVPAAGGVATRVTNRTGTMSSLSGASEAGRFAFVGAGPTVGSEAYALDAVGGRPRRLTAWAPAWAGLRAPEEVSYLSFDGLAIQGFLYLPPRIAVVPDGVPAPQCPALVQVHGGGTNSYQRGPNLTEQYLASRGFVVLAINYRGGSGFGRAFQDLAVEDWLNEQALDAGAAADFLRSLDYVNGKVGIYGGSYGGSMSLSAVSLTPDKFDAAVPMRGAYSKLNTLEYTDRLGKIFSITGHGGTPAERPDTYAKSDVVARIQHITAPVLLMHGELDRRVPIQNFEHAVAEFARHGIDVETVTYPDEAHGFRDPDNRIDMYTRLEAFFRRHLGSCGGV
ncbi:MAG: prolyl oligopeptidase family serine peptidase [Gemmatimonadetes bacterium]|nr:prolyl oligopeptidase family serine peptidase [Gemmatimonadota bacterium]